MALKPLSQESISTVSVMSNREARCTSAHRRQAMPLESSVSTTTRHRLGMGSAAYSGILIMLAQYQTRAVMQRVAHL